MDEEASISTSAVVSGTRPDSPSKKKQKRRHANSNGIPTQQAPPDSPPPSPLIGSTPTVVELELQAQIVELKANHVKGLKEIDATLQKHWSDLMEWGQTFAEGCQGSIDGVAEGAAVVRDDLAKLTETVEAGLAGRKDDAARGVVNEQKEVERDGMMRGMAKLLREEFKLEIASLRQTVEESRIEAQIATAEVAIAKAKITTLTSDLNRSKLDIIVYRTKVIEADKARAAKVEEDSKKKRAAEELQMLTLVSNLLKPALEKQAREWKVDLANSVAAQPGRPALVGPDPAVQLTGILPSAQYQQLVCRRFADIDQKLDQQLVPQLRHLEHYVFNSSRDYPAALRSMRQSIQQLQQMHAQETPRLTESIGNVKGFVDDEVQNLRTRLSKVEASVSQVSVGGGGGNEFKIPGARIIGEVGVS